MAHINDELRNLYSQNLLLLWICEDADPALAGLALKLRWPGVWSSLLPNDLERARQVAERPLAIAASPDEVPPNHTPSSVQIIFDVAKGDSNLGAQYVRASRLKAELENKLAGWRGGILILGQPTNELLDLMSALAPSATTFAPAGETSSRIGIRHRVISANQTELIEALRAYTTDSGRVILDLKDAPGIEIPDSAVRALGDNWELLDRSRCTPRLSIDQEQFDAFLSGDLDWPLLAAGVAAKRGTICQTQGKGRSDPIEHVRRRLRHLDRAAIDPIDAVEQVLIFAEQGSGCTTLLRQIALEMAIEGYPVLFAKPYPRFLKTEALANLLVLIQELWLEKRRGKGSGVGALPVCLILDCDAELPSRFSNFLRGISSELTRKFVVVRALQRSRDEISSSENALKLYTRTTEREMLDMGAHLRAFCTRNDLEPIPADNEWRAYYQALGRVKVHVEGEMGAYETPPLFLVGLYPFVKDRVRDERSLARYLYAKWSSIEDKSAQTVIEILSVAAMYGAAVPFECFLRFPELSSVLLNPLSKSDSRTFDFFVDWIKFGWHTKNWALHIRHPAFARLLTSMISPQESELPYSALCEMLEFLTGTEADRWFADQLAYRLGRYFDSEGNFFSLEYDTPPQRAAREIFSAFPSSIVDYSRVVCHHYARFYIHLLHACVRAIEYPASTRVPQHVVVGQARATLAAATELLEKAQGIEDPRDKASYLLTTLAAALSRLAKALSGLGLDEESARYFDEALKRADEAIVSDTANGHALFAYVNAAQSKMRSTAIENNIVEDFRLFEAAEDRLWTLSGLFESKLWRNTTQEDAEIQIGTLVARQRELGRALERRPDAPGFLAKTPAAKAMLQLRAVMQGASLSQSFLDASKAEEIRALRTDLEAARSDSAKRAEILYKLYLFDPLGRLNFERRLELLAIIARQLPGSYLPYRHDHAALLCQVGSVGAGSNIFREIYAARNADPDRWFWTNERLLVARLDGAAHAKLHVLRVVDPVQGWALYEGDTRVRLQPRLFADVHANKYISAYIKFRLAGLQAVDYRIARVDMQAMGFDPRNIEKPT